MAEPCHFPFDILGPCLPIPSVEKKNTNHAAGLSNQGGWAVAGLETTATSFGGVLPLMF